MSVSINAEVEVIRWPLIFDGGWDLTSSLVASVISFGGFSA